ncbi:MAG: SMEK domain-containing protein [bacterium]
MNRPHYYNYVGNKLCTLANEIESNGKRNILDLHIHSENFYRDFF